MQPAPGAPGFFDSVGARVTGRPRVVLLVWVLVAVALNVFVPQFETVVATKSAPFVPADSAGSRGIATMAAAFGSGGARANLVVVLEDPGGLGPSDRAYQVRLAAQLRAATARVAGLQDDVDTPAPAPLLRSADGRATYLAVGLRHAVGSPTAIEDLHWLRSTIGALHPPAGLTVAVSGDSAMVADLIDGVLHTLIPVTVIAVLLILGILLGIYRRWRLILLPLVTILITVACARGAIAFAGEHGMAVSTYTDAFLMVVALGAGTDYAVFLISRHQEYLAAGLAPAAAAARAVARLGPVLAASAATVMVGSAAMAAAKVAALHTLGPALAVTIAMSALVAATVVPAMLVLVGEKAAGTRSATSERRWRATGALLTRRPAAVLGLTVLALMPLAAFAPTVSMSVEENRLQPKAANTRALKILAAHYPHHVVLPDFLLLRSAGDLHAPRELDGIERISRAVAAVPGVVVVRGPTRPTGTAPPAPSRGGSLPATANPTPARAALAQFISADGHVVRLLASGDDEPLTDAGRHRLAAEQAAVRSALVDPALAGTALAGAQLEVTGAAAFGADLHDLLIHDMRLVMLVVLGAIFLILAVILRAVIAPLFLLASVVLSYAAALGLTVLIWTDLFGHPIEWYLPVMTFVILVAVGADYNLLVMARIREETPTGDRAGIAQALVSTGAVVTSAGLIFAGSFVALLASPLTGMAESGFTVAVGLLLDTLVVRTLIVPAAAMLLGPLSWWPSRPVRPGG